MDTDRGANLFLFTFQTCGSTSTSFSRKVNIYAKYVCCFFLVVLCKGFYITKQKPIGSIALSPMAARKPNGPFWTCWLACPANSLPWCFWWNFQQMGMWHMDGPSWRWLCFTFDISAKTRSLFFPFLSFFSKNSRARETPSVIYRERVCRYDEQSRAWPLTRTLCETSSLGPDLLTTGPGESAARGSATCASKNYHGGIGSLFSSDVPLPFSISVMLWHFDK